MLELKRGNLNNLEGKVLVYSFLDASLCGHPDHKGYPGVYASSDPTDIIAFKGIQLDEHGKELADKFKQFLKKVKENTSVVPIIGVHTALESHEEAATAKGDIIYAGEFSHVGTSFEALDGVLTFYMAKYSEQLEKRLGKTVQSNLKDSFSNYDDGAALKKRLYALVGELYHALDAKDEKVVSLAIANIRKFSEGSHFFSDAINLIGIAQTNVPGKHEVIAAYVEKAGAVKDERFEEAIAHQKKIEDLIRAK